MVQFCLFLPAGPSPTLIFSNRVDIRKIETRPTEAEYTAVVLGLENAIALDFHVIEDRVYWTDVTLDTIKRAFLNGTVIEDVISHGLQNPGRRVVGLLYYIMSSYHILYHVISYIILYCIVLYCIVLYYIVL